MVPGVHVDRIQLTVGAERHGKEALDLDGVALIGGLHDAIEEPVESLSGRHPADVRRRSRCARAPSPGSSHCAACTRIRHVRSRGCRKATGHLEHDGPEQEKAEDRRHHPCRLLSRRRMTGRGEARSRMSAAMTEAGLGRELSLAGRTGPGDEVGSAAAAEVARGCGSAGRTHAGRDRHVGKKGKRAKGTGTPLPLAGFRDFFPAYRLLFTAFDLLPLDGTCQNGSSQATIAGLGGATEPRGLPHGADGCRQGRHSRAHQAVRRRLSETSVHGHPRREQERRGAAGSVRESARR